MVLYTILNVILLINYIQEALYKNYKTEFVDINQKVFFAIFHLKILQVMMIIHMELLLICGLKIDNN